MSAYRRTFAPGVSVPTITVYDHSGRTDGSCPPKVTGFTLPVKGWDSLFCRARSEADSDIWILCGQLMSPVQALNPGVKLTKLLGAVVCLSLELSNRYGTDKSYLARRIA